MLRREGGPSPTPWYSKLEVVKAGSKEPRSLRMRKEEGEIGSPLEELRRTLEI
jgi:hypothetical protein